MKWPWCLGSAAVFFVVINALRVCVKTHMPYGHLSETSTDTDKTCPTTSPTDAINRITLRYNDMSQPFDVSAQVAGSLTPPSASFMTLTSDKMADFVFVTAASENHFLESMDAIASVQSVMPTKQIMYFDLGLTDNQVAEIKSWCSVTYIHFDMSSLPDYVRNLHSYAWKPFIIERALRNHSAIFWIDSSFRLMGTDLTDTYRTAMANGGIVLFIRTDHSNYVATHPDMYRYLVTDVEAQKTIEQFGTGAILIYRTEKVFRQVLWWFYLCSLERRCLQPIANRFCRLDPKDRYATHAHCHRFDQAIVNLLLSNIWLTDGTPYTAKEDFFKIHRYVTNMYNVKVCSSTRT